jgi:phosphopantothenoylcysteine decarboxylase/phosphopantothenate--cysteine ligase
MRVALGVSGGIAAYKAAEIVRLLQERGLDVQVVMTAAAREFVSPLTFAALSGHKVITDVFAGTAGDANLESAIEHIAVAQSVDALLIAPATADILAKIAHGLADDFLTTLVLATRAPLIVAPAMNVNMWENPATQANLNVLRARGVRIVEPDEGYLACGMVGPGRLAALESIMAAVCAALGLADDLRGQTVLVTAGPTEEAIDPVRYISNRSSGKMGYAVAEAARRRGADVILVSGPTQLEAASGVTLHRVRTADEMARAVFENLDAASIVVMTAAVADYRPSHLAPAKIKRNGG